MNVLLVDDERLALGVMASGLRDQGIRVTEANNARQALELWQEHSFDVLLTDIAMPGMSGLDLARQINEIRAESPSRLPGHMVALTANYRCASDELKDVFDRILCKPITAANVALALTALAEQGPTTY